MEFKVITVDQFNKDHGTDWKSPMSEYKGDHSYLYMGVTPEVMMKDGTLNAESTTFIREIEELNDDFWTWHRDDMSYKYKWTGRLVFRGYYYCHYDPDERDEYYVEEKL